MESPKICLIYRKPCLSNFSTIFQKGADGINKVSRLKNVNFTVIPGMHVHVSFRKNYTRAPGVPSSSTEVSYRKTRTSSGGYSFRKDCFYRGCLITEKEKKTNNHVMSLVTTARLIRQSIKLSLTEKLIVCPLKLRRYAFVNDLRAEDAVYHIQCSSNFCTDKGNPKKSVMPRKRGRHTKKEYFSKSLNI